MKLNQLHTFLAVAKYLSLHEVSSELHLTQSGISKQLAVLQRDIGTRLYKRNGKGIELTEAGRLLLIKITPAVKQLEDVLETFRRKLPQEKEPVVVSLAGAFSIAANVLPSIIARFEKTHPGVTVNCHTGTSQQIEQLISEGRAELGVNTYRPLSAEIACEPFRVQSLVFFVNSSHPLATRRHITLLDVLACPLVIRSMMGGPTWTHDILEQLSERGFKYKVALECNGPLQVKEAVARNIGVGLSYIDNLKADVARKRFVVLKGADFQFTTLSYILYSQKHGLSPAAHEFLALLRQARKIPVGKNLDEITGVMKHRGLNLVTKNRNSSG